MTAGIVGILPPLAPEQAEQAGHVARMVRQRIEGAGGWLSFDEYLRAVLYAPGLGYYSAGGAKLGRAGDFITAPELSGLFGRAVGRQCAEILQRVGGDILELGAGSGSLASALLPMLHELDSLPQHYDILEVSAELAERARARLARLPEDLRRRIRWRTSLPEEPMTGVLLANEVADALPFRRFAVGRSGLLERGVTLSASGELALADRPADRALAAELRRIAASPADAPAAVGPWPVGYESELCELINPWIASLSDALARGVLLIADYGLPRRDYYHPERMHGTLRCHFRHRAHEDALLYPGLQDITAWVDFTRVAEAGAYANLEVCGYCTQTAFLLANGIEADVANAAEDVERARRAAEARTLLLPGEMGEHCKVMALARGWQGAPRGFAYQDLRRTL